ncbi:MAG: T9SS type A sorting domain-containing protein [Clostridia bacterium]|nr:T9SS type A sorting domain-containing protein [Clostridia bacterium]
MKKSVLFIAMFFVAVFATAQTDLFFSEYVEGSGNNKGVEIYNPTTQTIDLTNYWVARFSNGESTFTSGGVTQLTGTLEPYKTHVLVNGQTTSTPTSPACDPALQAIANQLDHDYPAPTYMNGNDAIALMKTPNGETPLEDMSNVTAVDLIGQIGLGSAISSETGWSYVKDSTLTYNNAAGEPVTGKVVNYIVRKYATNGSDYGPFWMSWTSDHSLIRKPNVLQGVVSSPSPFIVDMEWDTVPGRIDPETGHIVYKDIWDNLGTHVSIAKIDEPDFGGTLNIYPNPVVADHFTLSSNMMMKSVVVFDLLGKQVVEQTFSNPLNEAEVAIAENYNGLYLVKIYFVNGATTTQKILIK